VAAVLSVLALAVFGHPLLSEGAAVEPLTLPASAIADAATPTPGAFEWFVPGGRNEGAEDLAMALAAIALHDNAPLYLSDTWGRRWGPAKSDHHVGNPDTWAVDLAVRGVERPTPQTEGAARRVAAALGRPNWSGGDLQVTIQGYRFQVLWKVSGHFNHVHVGVKKL
jgi:hypothetical protein